MLKKILVVFLTLASILTFRNSLSQDTSIIKYFPLQVGNVWVYHCNYYLGGYSRVRVTGSSVYNNHLYYQLTFDLASCNCKNNPFGSGEIYQNPSYMRIDSTDGNVMLYGISCPWHPNEGIFDSIKTMLGVYNSNSCAHTLCLDTNVSSIFGVLRKTKYVEFPILTWYEHRRYAYGIGISSSDYGCYANTTGSFTLLGAVINGVVHGDTAFLTGLQQISSNVPEGFSLSQNYPNPFNPKTVIKFDIPPSKGDRGMTIEKLVIYDALGKEVATLVNQHLSPGTYQADWDGANYPSGVYFYQLSANDELIATKKMLLIK